MYRRKLSEGLISLLMRKFDTFKNKDYSYDRVIELLSKEFWESWKLYRDVGTFGNYLEDVLYRMNAGDGPETGKLYFSGAGISFNEDIPAIDEFKRYLKHEGVFNILSKNFDKIQDEEIDPVIFTQDILHEMLMLAEEEWNAENTKLHSEVAQTLNTNTPKQIKSKKDVRKDSMKKFGLEESTFKGDTCIEDTLVRIEQFMKENGMECKEKQEANTFHIKGLSDYGTATVRLVYNGDINDTDTLGMYYLTNWKTGVHGSFEKNGITTFIEDFIELFS